MSDKSTVMHKGRVSVCIPSYNASRFIRQTIKSVLASSYTNLEVIVNDDASTDSTRAIVEGIDDNRVRFFQNERTIGVPGNWNYALQRASGEFVGLLNHDDLYGQFWLTLAVHVLRKYPHIGWVATAFRIVDNDGQTLRAVSHLPETREYSRSDAFLCVAKLDGLGAYIARREIIEQVGYYDDAIGASADNDLYLRLASRYPLYYSSNPHHAAWRLHSDNLTHRWGLVDQVSEGLKTLQKAFSDDTLPEELRTYKQTVYTYIYGKVLSRALERLENDELETVQHLVRLLDTCGYQA